MTVGDSVFPRAHCGQAPGLMVKSALERFGERCVIEFKDMGVRRSLLTERTDEHGKTFVGCEVRGGGSAAQKPW